MAGIKPTNVTFLNQGQATGKYPLVDSHYSSLDDESYFTQGNPEQAVIIGPVNAQVTFFDDQQYRTGENSMLVSLKREGTESNPVIVDVTYRRLGNGDHPNGIYNGQEESFGWILYKQAKESWVQSTLSLAGKFIALVNSVIGQVPGGASWQQYTSVAGVVVQKLQGFDPSGTSDNSQVDNISSVLFGTFDG
jgi:hypothetical protein